MTGVQTCALPICGQKGGNRNPPLGDEKRPVVFGGTARQRNDPGHTGDLADARSRKTTNPLRTADQRRKEFFRQTGPFPGKYLDTLFKGQINFITNEILTYIPPLKEIFTPVEVGSNKQDREKLNVARSNIKAPWNQASQRPLLKTRSSYVAVPGFHVPNIEDRKSVV